jgi:aspartate/methionine/tyrosine aminotransferase
MPLSLQDLGKAVLETEYAVRGPIVARALELEKSGREITYCNIGNPQALEQKPLSWVRRVLALCEYPELAEKAPGAFPADAIAAAKAIFAGTKHGLGAYSESKGVRCIREAVAAFIQESGRHTRRSRRHIPYRRRLQGRAGRFAHAHSRPLRRHHGAHPPVSPLLGHHNPLRGQAGQLLPGRAQRLETLQADARGALAEAKRFGVRVKGIVVINPGNPTGSVIDAGNIAMIIDFAKEHGLAILADEVYQENVYKAGERFTSFAKVMKDKDERSVSLFSFHSTSKGYLGECGHRGGYFEIRNIPQDVTAQLLKLQSVSLCANLPGQAAVYCMVSPPKAGRAQLRGIPSGARGHTRRAQGAGAALRGRPQ